MKRFLNNIGLMLLLSLFGCGRKQKNIFEFEQQQKKDINRLQFPVVLDVYVRHEREGIHISWLPIDDTSVQDGYAFVGYNIYGLLRPRIIPKAPMNKQPVKTTSFYVAKDSAYSYAQWFMVRPAFMRDQHIIEGPFSRIVS